MPILTKLKEKFKRIAGFIDLFVSFDTRCRNERETLLIQIPTSSFEREFFNQNMRCMITSSVDRI